MIQVKKDPFLLFTFDLIKKEECSLSGPLIYTNVKLIKVKNVREIRFIFNIKT
jgi:hypothetical protein